MTIGEKLKQRRNNLGLTLKELKEKCGISQQLISDYENDRKEPGIKNIKLLCKALKISADYLISDDENQTNGSTNTYGYALSNYFNALNVSKKDRLVIDKETRTARIDINDEVLVNVLVQIKDFLDVGGDVAEGMKNFNINLLSNIEIK